MPENSKEFRDDETEILRVLHLHNPWWESKRVPSSKALPFKRRDFYKLLEELKDPKVAAIIGARRVGKTVLMYQLIEHIISNFGPEKVMYLSLDDPYLKVDVKILGQIFDLYSKYILKRPFSDITEPVYIFLDEIQTLDGWELVLKRWFDLDYKVKFLVSGSSSVNILTGGAESLVGRIHLQIVFPMKFLETIRFHMADEDFERRFDKVNWELREAFKIAIQKNDVAAFYSALRENANLLAGDIDRIMLFLQSYLLKGGYPEVVKAEDLDLAAESLKTYLNLTIYKDIVRTFKIRDPVAFEELVAVLARECCQRLNYSELARTLELKRHTLKSYIYFLKTAFLISESEYYSKSRTKRIRREKKVYINDSGIRNVAVGALNDYLLTNTAELGKVVEAIVADHCRRLKFDLEPASETQLFYWKNKGHETDIIVDMLQKPIPIEVKYRDKIDRKDLKGLLEFSEKHKTPFQAVITREKLDLSGNTVSIPLWLFLLMC
ncbi:MAG: ATP-binding protein [Candidatus Bathyarchaeota archaeon]|nr:ATP-binding protein [Candidatus Bathyarchaeota archaeon]